MTDIAPDAGSRPDGGAPDEERASEDQPEAARPGSLRRLREGRLGPVLLGLLSVVPPLMMLREVLRYPQMHFFDYWWVLLDLTRDDGSLRPEALFGFRNEHPSCCRACCSGSAPATATASTSRWGC